ncbi:MAG: acetolactate synthase small subunit [Prevotellaceae bacterium]|nr:acetolactate synthase small subunit [Prevotellaceae bacterium]MDO4931876.1 acetolactate synthase small subunit [Prevotellaceae bacterium]
MEQETNNCCTKNNRPVQEEHKGSPLYTLQVYTENIAGILNQITAVFTRRQINIESLNVSPSSIKGIHKYTITAYCDEPTIQKVVKQIEKKIDVVKAHYYLNSDLFLVEVALFKIATPQIMVNPEMSRAIRHANARITEVNETFCIVVCEGTTDHILNLFHELNKNPDNILQFTRSGRIAVTRNCQEEVSRFLHERGESL